MDSEREEGEEESLFKAEEEEEEESLLKADAVGEGGGRVYTFIEQYD